LSGVTVFNLSPLDLFDTLCTTVLIPIGGLASVVLVGWKWGAKEAFVHLREGGEGFFDNNRWVQHYFRLCFRYIAPVLIIVVFLNALGQLNG
jgi:NSS family neurotransmitter:Na+ symporter